jgi:hypothetical protein
MSLIGPELRSLRWVGRGLTLAAAWPFWYAFYGKSQFDWDAMIFGGPGMLAGLTLWSWAGYRLRKLEPDRSGKQFRTLGGWLAARFDAIVDSSTGERRVGATIGLGLVTLLWAGLAATQLVRTDGDALGAAVVLAVGFAALSLGWRRVVGPGRAALLAALAGSAFVAKPWYAPVFIVMMGEVHYYSPTSETHFYYVLPGVGLCLLAGGFVLTIELGAQARVDAPVEPEPVSLPPPRPEPPSPPSGEP